MAVPFSNTTLRVPMGFPSLLEGLSREVLRHQPKDIYGFAEKYFEGILKKREETGIEDIAQLTARLDDRYYNNQAYNHLNLSSSNAEQRRAAVTIQTEYRRHHAQGQAEELRKEKAALQIQSTFRGYHARKSLQIGVAGQQGQIDNIKPQSESEEAEDHSHFETQSSSEQELAATRIQAQYRGYTVRKTLQSRNSEVAHSDHSPGLLSENEEASITQPNTTEETVGNQFVQETDQTQSAETEHCIADSKSSARTESEASEENLRIEQKTEEDAVSLADTSVSELITEDSH